MTDKQTIVSRYSAANLEAAMIIAADPVTYPEGSLMQQWAALVLAKAQPKIEGPLFRAERAA